jgi:hypothetical protein
LFTGVLQFFGVASANRDTGATTGKFVSQQQPQTT